MGIQGFSKAFKNSGEKKLKNFSGKTFAIDGSTEIYRAALGAKNVKMLTDSSGNPTLHLSVIVNNILAFKKNKINQIWVFDNDKINGHKKLEIEERRRQKNRAQKKLEKVKQKKKTLEEELFSDSDEDLDHKRKEEELKEEEEKLERQVFKPPSWMFSDIKFLLEMFNISYVEAPNGTEAECIAARLTHKDVEMADAVLSQDTDPIIFKAKVLVRRVKKKYVQYDYKNIVEDNDITHTQLIKAALVLGCDFYKDNLRPESTQLFRGIGPKTVVKKIKGSSLDEKFKDAEIKSVIKYLRRKCKVDRLKWVNKNSTPFSNKKNNELVLNWLVDKKSFSDKIWRKRFKDHGLM